VPVAQPELVDLFCRVTNFYELSTPTAEAIVAWGIGVAVGVGGMVVALRLFMRGDFEALAEARSAPNQPTDQ
jgi:hypothetical protein